MSLKDTRSTRFLVQGDVDPKNVEDSLRVHDRNVQELDSRLEITNSALDQLGDLIGEAPTTMSFETFATRMSGILKTYKRNMARLNRGN